MAGSDTKFHELNDQGKELMFEKIYRQFMAARHYKAPLIAGAFGSGSYSIHPIAVAKLHHQIALQFPDVELHFAIFDEFLFNIYVKEFYGDDILNQFLGKRDLKSKK